MNSLSQTKQPTTGNKLGRRRKWATFNTTKIRDFTGYTRDASLLCSDVSQSSHRTKATAWTELTWEYLKILYTGTSGPGSLG